MVRIIIGFVCVLSCIYAELRVRGLGLGYDWVETGTLRPGQYFSIFKMPDGRTPRGSPSRETIPSPSMVCRYIRAYIPTYTIECELIFY